MILLFCMSRRIVKKAVKKYPFFPCLEKCNVSIAVEISKNAQLPQLFFVDSNSRCKDLLSLRGSNLAQKPLYFKDTVIKTSTWNSFLQHK